ncbi:MAG: Ig-like domain-containing protein, partial [Desulfuromonadales bacterium]|nr:Ig-like domain-containing protein [Desulfuromonadales bacterium]
GPDGTFLFAGVPAGQFSLEANDPSNNLRGYASGTISYESEVAQAELRIAPTGSIQGQVWLPDGVTPATNARVAFNGVTTLVDPETGSFSYGNLAAGRSYTMIAAENGTHRAKKEIVTIHEDSEVARADIVLRGIGSVEGIVYDADGVTPLDGATVHIYANGTVNADYTDYTGADGRFRFIDVPASSFTLKASHPQRSTAASSSGKVLEDGEVVVRNMTIGPVASVTGAVLLADGSAPAAGGGVRFNGNGEMFRTVIDSQGQFLFGNIPVPCNFSLYMEDGNGLGISRYSGALTENGVTLDIGTVILDDQTIAIAEVDPVSGSVNVSVEQNVKILFSEPFERSSVNSNSIYLSQGGNKVAGSLLPDGDNTGVTFYPAQPLKGFALYTIVATTAVEDLVGRKLEQNYASTFTTIDNVPPSVTSVSPDDDATEISPEAVVRITFSEAIDQGSIDGIRLLRGGVAVETQLDLTQGGTVAILTPLYALATDTLYTLDVAAARDTLGNTMSQAFNSSFSSIDTLAPSIGELGVAADADLIYGNNVTVNAAVSASDTAQVDFFVDGVFVGSDQSAPFSLNLTLAQEGEMRIKAIAQDQVGNRGISKELTLNVAADQPPSANIVAPAQDASVYTGQSFTVQITGSDDLSISHATLVASGAAEFEQSKATSGKTPTINFSVPVPADAAPGSEILLTAVVTDSAGQQSAQMQRSVIVHDAIAPSITLVSVGETERYAPASTGSASLSASDNAGVSQINCSVSGAASGEQSFTLEGMPKTVNEDFTFEVSPNAAAHASISLVCSASDAAGNASSAYLTLYVADLVAPSVVASSITDNDTEVPINALLRITFDEPLAAETVNAASVTFKTR